MYNHKLEMVQKFGQENSTLPYFFSPKNNVFLVSNKYFIINETVIDENEYEDHYSLKLINRSNGLVEGSFKIFEKFNQMRLYMDKFLITFNNETCFLRCYNFKGDLLHKITLDKKFGGSFFRSINKELCFYLLKRKSFCIF